MPDMQTPVLFIAIDRMRRPGYRTPKKNRRQPRWLGAPGGGGDGYRG
jgi:hypothetical protein